MLAAVAGDRRGEELLYRRHVHHVHGLLLRLLGNPADAEDATQETFAIALDRLGELREPAALRGWLTQIAASRARRRFRRAGLLRALGLDRGDAAVDLVPAPQAPYAEAATLRQLVARLAADDRMASASSTVSPSPCSRRARPRASPRRSRPPRRPRLACLRARRRRARGGSSRERGTTTRPTASSAPAASPREAAVATVDDRFALADVARLSDHGADAVPPLTRVVEAYPTDPRAAVAAFTLGRLELDTLDHPARASAAFGRAVAMGRPAGLTEDAYARLVEASVKAGDVAGARRARAEFAAKYPRGARSSMVDRWLSLPALQGAP